jgi:hypothetical protein
MKLAQLPNNYIKKIDETNEFIADRFNSLYYLGHLGLEPKNDAFQNENFELGDETGV